MAMVLSAARYCAASRLNIVHVLARIKTTNVTRNNKNVA
jgi:hypothetical protein